MESNNQNEGPKLFIAGMRIHALCIPLMWIGLGAVLSQPEGWFEDAWYKECTRSAAPPHLSQNGLCPICVETLKQEGPFSSS